MKINNKNLVCNFALSSKLKHKTKQKNKKF